ncbi:hypothetical protein [Shinella sp.]|uniref:hypothetical protein n=1 Tax=Shinella sp. TaxID=1870904 RepID=UPI00289A6CBD|nr:hypothetical protein [Shinella sp.]
MLQKTAHAGDCLHLPRQPLVKYGLRLVEQRVQKQETVLAFQNKENFLPAHTAEPLGEAIFADIASRATQEAHFDPDAEDFLIHQHAVAVKDNEFDIVHFEFPVS